MKGDGSIKTIKFIGSGYKDKYQVYLKIYYNNKLIFEGYTYNGIVKIKLKENKIYKIIALTSNEQICTNLYVSKKQEYVFILNRIIIGRTVTFLLRDYYYNLPIERGDLILWQKQ